jgi:hypothetical protein
MPTVLQELNRWIDLGFGARTLLVDAARGLIINCNAILSDMLCGDFVATRLIETTDRSDFLR